MGWAIPVPESPKVIPANPWHQQTSDIFFHSRDIATRIFLSQIDHDHRGGGVGYSRKLMRCDIRVLYPLYLYPYIRVLYPYLSIIISWWRSTPLGTWPSWNDSFQSVTKLSISSHLVFTCFIIRIYNLWFLFDSKCHIQLNSNLGHGAEPLDLRLDEFRLFGIKGAWWVNVAPAWNISTFLLGKTSNTTLRILSVRGVPSPLYGQNFRQKKSYGFGRYLPSPLYGFSPENFSSKRAKNVFFCSKNTWFWSKK